MATSAIDEPLWTRPELRTLTPELAGLPGRYRVRLEDFRVDEELEPDEDADGDHLLVHVEKRGLTTEAAVERLARHLGLRPSSVGRAGRKDARGVTRQWLSVEHVAERALEGFGAPDLRVLATARRRRKLRLGVFRCNRFRLRLRGEIVGRSAEVELVLARVVERGLPNYFGPQRFGQRGDNALVGWHLVRGEHDQAVARLLGAAGPRDSEAVARAREHARAGRFAEAQAAFPPGFGTEARLARLMVERRGRAAGALRALGRRPLGIFVSALQSHLFNAVLSRRMPEPARILPGDLRLDAATGRLIVDEGGVPTGPLPGPRLRAPTEEAGALEAEVLGAHGFDLAALDERAFLGLGGARRPLVVSPSDLVARVDRDDHGAFLELAFALPPGSFATALLHELGKGALVEAEPSAAPATMAPLDDDGSE